MDISLIPVLGDAMKEYYESEELIELCGSLSIECEVDQGDKLAIMKLARNLIERSEHGNNRLFLETILPSLDGRASKRVATTSWTHQDYHAEMLNKI